MAYREAAEKSGMDWKKAYQEFYAGQKDATAKVFMDSLDKDDHFVPDALNKLTDVDLPDLLKLAARIFPQAVHNSYNYFFLHLVKKAIVLVLQNFPEALATLSPQDKEMVFGTKIDLPDEEAVYNHVYVYTQGAQEMPYGTIDNGATMASILKIVNNPASGNSKEKPVNQRVVDSLTEMDSQYSIYFMRKRLGM